MVEIPRFTIEQTDGALTALPDEALHAKVGVAAGGAWNSPVLVASKRALVDAFVSGPLVEAVALQLDVAKRPVLCCAVNHGVAGAIGDVVRSGGGGASLGLAAGGGNTSVTVPTLSGTPRRPYALRLRISVAGANLAASPRFVYSLDGGLTWSAAVTAVAGPIALGDTGLAIAWTDASFVLDDTWSGEIVSNDQQGTGILAVTGSPSDTFGVVVEILRGAANLAANTATYRASFDGGESFGPEMAMPVGGVVQPSNTGLTLTFTNGAGTAFVEGDRFSFDTRAPGFTLSDLSSAWNALLAAPYDVEGVHVVGAVDDVTATGVDVLTVSAIGENKPRWVILEARDQTAEETESEWMTALQTAFGGFVSSLGRVFVAAGACDVISVLSSRTRRTSIGILAAARAAAVPYSEDLAWVGRGAIPGVVQLHHNEDSQPGLNFARFITARTHQGLTGFYLTNPVSMAAPGSDYELLQHRRVWDRAFRVLRRTMLPALSQDFAVNPEDVQEPLVPGAIDEAEAVALEDRGADALTEALLRTRPQHASEVAVSVDRAQNLLTSRNLIVGFELTPKGYAKSITGRLGFVNPARVAR